MVKPDWVKEPVQTLDARPMLAAGEHPLSKVMAGLATLGAGEVYLLVTPFPPAPLVDVAKGQGYAAWTDPSDPAAVKTYFTKAG